MKKVLLLCFLFVFSTTFYAQETKVGKAVDKAAVKTKEAAKDVKDGTVKTAHKVADKSKKGCQRRERWNCENGRQGFGQI